MWHLWVVAKSLDQVKSFWSHCHCRIKLCNVGRDGTHWCWGYANQAPSQWQTPSKVTGSSLSSDVCHYYFIWGHFSIWIWTNAIRFPTWAPVEDSAWACLFSLGVMGNGWRKDQGESLSLFLSLSLAVCYIRVYFRHVVTFKQWVRKTWVDLPVSFALPHSWLVTWPHAHTEHHSLNNEWKQAERNGKDVSLSSKAIQTPQWWCQHEAFSDRVKDLVHDPL